MEIVNVNANCPMRDPMGDVRRYEYLSSYYLRTDEKWQKTFADEFLLWDEQQRIVFESSTVTNIQKNLVLLYCLGHPIGELMERLQKDIPFIRVRTTARQQRWAKHTGLPINTGIGHVYGYNRKEGFAYSAIALLLIADQPELISLSQAVDTSGDYRSYAFEILLKAFIPQWKLIKKYPRQGSVKFDLIWADPLVRALSVAPDKRTDALAQYMKSWNRLMKPWGWKPTRVYCPLDAEGMQIDHACSGDWLFVDFAFEAALAVCAYDLDDSSFRDHPYYPRDLVDYYRANIRHTRDAWRAQGVGADIEIEPPPLPKKLDLTKSKSKGLARWVELVSDGDKDATESVVEQVGKLRKVKDVGELSCALAENDAGLYADLKDDDTLISQIDTLTEKRQLEFEAPLAVAGGYAAGVGRCAGVLLSLDRWLQGRPYRLLALDTQDDSWQAVLVARAHGDEFEQLSAALGIALLAPQDAFDV